MPGFAAPGKYRRGVVGDAQLAVAAAGGDRDALADIYDRYANTVYELCRVVLGDAGLPGPTVSVWLSGAKAQLAGAVRCTLLIRSGGGGCAELTSLTPRKHAALDALTRKRVARHAASCATCAPTWNASPDALG